jgi:thioredoxin-like negative regulator of GroEL
MTRWELARALSGLESYAEAEAEFRAVIQDLERVVGAMAPATLSARCDLADTLVHQGWRDEAVHQLRELLLVHRTVYGKDSPVTRAVEEQLERAISGMG